MKLSTETPQQPNKFENEADRRRTIRIRRSGLLSAKLISLDKPAIKVAENREEYSGSFKMLYQEYHKVGYTPQHPDEMLYNKWALLPTTSIFIFKSDKKVISSVSFIKDTKLFGLPFENVIPIEENKDDQNTQGQDQLVKGSIQALRDQGRSVAEIGALATSSSRRWSNLMIWLFRAMYRYATMAHIDDVVLMVNPKHVRFYSQILLFEPFGATVYYEKVGAPAVPMRIDMRTYEQRLIEAYAKKNYPIGEGESDPVSENVFDTNLHAFFTRFSDSTLESVGIEKEGKRDTLTQDDIDYFLKKRPELKVSMTSDQWDFMQNYKSTPLK